MIRTAESLWLYNEEFKRGKGRLTSLSIDRRAATLDLKNVMMAFEEYFESFSELPRYQHREMGMYDKADAKDYEMKRFVKAITQNHGGHHCD